MNAFDYDDGRPVQATPRRLGRELEDWSVRIAALALRGRRFGALVDGAVADRLVGELMRIAQQAADLATMTAIGDTALVAKYALAPAPMPEPAEARAMPRDPHPEPEPVPTPPPPVPVPSANGLAVHTELPTVEPEPEPAKCPDCGGLADKPFTRRKPDTKYACHFGADGKARRMRATPESVRAKREHPPEIVETKPDGGAVDDQADDELSVAEVMNEVAELPPGTERTPRGVETPWRLLPIEVLEHYGYPPSTIKLMREGKVQTVGDLSDLERKAGLAASHIHLETTSLEMHQVKRAMANLSAARARGEHLTYEVPDRKRKPPKTAPGTADKLSPFILLHGRPGGPYEQVHIPGPDTPRVMARTIDDAIAAVRAAVDWQCMNFPDGLVVKSSTGAVYRISESITGCCSSWLPEPGWRIEPTPNGSKVDIRGFNEWVVLPVLKTEPRLYDVSFRDVDRSEHLTTVKAQTRNHAEALGRHWLARYRPMAPDWKIVVKPIEEAKAERKAERRSRSKRELAAALSRPTAEERARMIEVERGRGERIHEEPDDDDAF